MYIKNPRFGTITKHIHNLKKFKIIKNKTHITIINKERNKPRHTFSFPDSTVYIDYRNRIVWHTGLEDNVSAIIDQIKDDKYYNFDTFDWRIPEDTSFYIFKMKIIEFQINSSLTLQKSITDCIYEDIFKDFYTTINLMMHDFNNFKSYIDWNRFEDTFVPQLVSDYKNRNWIIEHDNNNNYCVHSTYNKEYIQVTFDKNNKTVTLFYKGITQFKPSLYFLIQYEKLSKIYS